MGQRLNSMALCDPKNYLNFLRMNYPDILNRLRPVRELAVFSSILAVCLAFSSVAGAQEYTSAALDCYSAVSRGAENMIQLCRTAAGANDAHAMYLLAQNSDDSERRIKLLEGAVAQKHLRAMVMLARIRWNSGEKDKALALERSAAELGHGPSRIAIANRMRRAPGDKVKLRARARRILLQEAENGYPQAQYHVALMMRDGEGGPVDLDGAYRWSSEAAASGMVQAQYELGMELRQSRPAQSSRWLLKAAHGGHSGAMLQMAAMYVGGDGVEPDVQKSYRWVHLAIRSGHPQGTKVLSRLNQEVAKQGRRKASNVALSSSREVSVLDVQKALARLGYDPGPLDGEFGTKTRLAIEQFENRNNLPVTGAATEILLEQLKSSLSGRR